MSDQQLQRTDCVADVKSKGIGSLRPGRRDDVHYRVEFCLVVVSTYTHGLEEVALTLLCRVSRYHMISCRGRLLEMKAKQKALLPTAIVYNRTSEHLRSRSGKLIFTFLISTVNRRQGTEDEHERRFAAIALVLVPRTLARLW
jgi:hypothetical protein